MREIKFRAWDLHKMHYNVYVTGSREVYDPNGGFWRRVENVMQYTGLKDKNGKEIYECDIVKLDNGDEETTTEVRFVDGAFIVEWDNGFLGGDADLQAVGWANHECTIEVIGNIYENPELLKK